MWFELALISACVSALGIVVSKRVLVKVDPVVFYWATFTLYTPFLLIAILKNGLPEISRLFFIGTLASIALYNFSKILSYKVIRDSHLSHVYPLIALTPVFSMLAALFPPLSERPGPLAIFGVATTILGAYTLNISTRKESFWEPFRILIKNRLSALMLVSVALTGVISVLDKIAMLGTTPRDPLLVLFFENFLIFVSMLPYLLLRHKGFIKEMATNFKWIFIAALIIGVGNAFGISAVKTANVGLVSAVFRSQVFFVFLFGYLFFKDKPRGETIVGTFIMVLGLALIRLGS